MFISIFQSQALFVLLRELKNKGKALHVSAVAYESAFLWE